MTQKALATYTWGGVETMKIPSAAVTVLAISLLCGCATPEQRAARAEAELQNYRGWLMDKCASYGLKYNSPEMSQCMMQVDQAQQNRNAALINALANQPRPQPQQLPQPYLMPTNPVPVQRPTQCQWIGQVWMCN